MSFQPDPQERYKPFAQAVCDLRTRLKIPPSRLGFLLSVPEYLVSAWESGTQIGNRQSVAQLSTIAFKNNWFDLAAIFKEERDRESRRKYARGPVRAVSPDATAKQHGREMTLIEVLHLIEERGTEIRSDQTMYDELTGLGMSVSDIVAYELELVMAAIRALPVVALTREPHKQRQA